MAEDKVGDEIEKYLLRRQARKDIDSYDLPSSVIKFDNQRDNSRIYVIGTAHFSRESCNEVEELIHAVQPDVVMLELCKSRASIATINENHLLDQAENMDFQNLRAIFSRNGLLSGIVHILFINLTASITKQLGIAPGCEFRSAVKEALKVPGCKIQLGDRPIEITMKRTVASLSIWQRVKLIYNLIVSDKHITKDEIEKMKDQDLLMELLHEISDSFPSLAQVIIAERDAYLAYSLLQAKDIAARNLDSLWDPEPPVVVGVVGLGHVNGIIENWGKPVDVQELLRIPIAPFSSRLFSFLTKVSIYAVAIYGLFKICKWRKIDF